MRITNYMTRSLHDGTAYIICSTREHNGDGDKRELLINYPPDNYALKHFGQKIQSSQDWATFLSENTMSIEKRVRGKKEFMPIFVFSDLISSGR